MRNYIILITLCLVSFLGCQKDNFVTESVNDKLNTVTLTAEMPSDETKAAISSEDGMFSWQENDKISVLGSDDIFYTLMLKSGSGTNIAEFEGKVPQGVTLTDVALHPDIIANGTRNNIYDVVSGKLTYNLPTSYDYVKDCSNVPMVAHFEPGTTDISFKQIGGVIRFTINGMPEAAKIVFTAKNKKSTGAFSVADVNGSEVIASEDTEGSNSSVIVNYASDVIGNKAEINIPVPVGTYNEFSIEIFNSENAIIVKKDYERGAKPINRATLLMMKAIDAGPISIKEVWPFFVDARVVWTKFDGATGYAVYVDDAEEPVMVAGVENDDIVNSLIGGQFAHHSTHKVAVAKVIDGEVIPVTKSEYIEFTTGDVYQMKYNTGTKFVCAGWDDVAIGIENSTQYLNGQWTPCAQIEGVNTRDMRGYRVQLYAEDKATLLYDEVPFSGQCDYGGTFTSSSWIGKINDANVLLPPSLSFGWLEPGKKYYFRVQTLSEGVTFDSPENGNFEPSTAGYMVSSARGGSAWSEFVEMVTDSEYVLGETDVFHEGFDDMMFNSDIMNMAPGVVPEILTTSTKKSDYENRKSADKYKSFAAKTHAERKWSEQGFNTMLHVYEHGLTDDNYSNSTTPRVLTDYAKSLSGWSIVSTSKDRNVYPNFGTVRIGQSGTNVNGAEFRTPAIYSEKLSDEKSTKCIITAKVSSSATTTTNITSKIAIHQYRPTETGTLLVDAEIIDYSKNSDGSTSSAWTANYYGTEADVDATDYLHRPTWFDVKTSVYLKNGDIIGFERYKDGVNRGLLVLGDIKIEVDPSDDGSGVDRYYGTAPDNTDYDVWGLDGKMPVTFWMGPPVLDYTDFSNLSDSEISNIKTTYFDPIVEGGYNLIEIANPYPKSMQTILEWCTSAGVKLLDKSIKDWSVEGTPAQMERVAQYAGASSYAGAFVGPDEPGAKSFATYSLVADAYLSRFSTSARTINLFPSYANNHQINCGNVTCDNNHGLVRDFAEYVKYFAQAVPSVNCMMFDHYCLSKSDKNGKANRGEVKSKQYYDLDLFRSVSLENRIPYLMITHGRPQWDPGYSATIANTDPAWTTDVSATALPAKPNSHVYDEQRWLVWSQIALGSKGVSYFCYWTPTGFRGGPFSFHYDGTKTRMYDILKNINNEIQPIGSILMKCHADGAIMTNPIGNFTLYENSGMGLSSYGPVLGVERGNEEDILVGCFRDASSGEYKVLVTHKSPATNDIQADTPSIAKLVIDESMVTKVKLHTVTLAADKETSASTVVSEHSLEGARLTLNIPDGTAILVEFPETAGKTYN